MFCLTHKKKQSHFALAFKSKLKGAEITKEITITSHLKQLYKAENSKEMTLLRGPYQVKDMISLQETKVAIKRLGLKATGTDQLRAIHLKDNELKEILSKKLTYAFNEWLHTGHSPKYITESKLLALSK